MNTTSKYALTFLAFVITAGLMAFPVLSFIPNKSITTTAATVYAQSQSESQQKTSQPPEEQKPQTGTQYIFNNKSRPANAPEHCASLVKWLAEKGFLIMIYAIS